MHIGIATLELIVGMESSNRHSNIDGIIVMEMEADRPICLLYLSILDKCFEKC